MEAKYFMHGNTCWFTIIKQTDGKYLIELCDNSTGEYISASVGGLEKDELQQKLKVLSAWVGHS